MHKKKKPPFPSYWRAKIHFATQST
uniref:Uncharacterized protein n=1 Tax=Anguilla anguilla TaxID=7936 RepID=A0A0E9W958_ANGAN